MSQHQSFDTSRADVPPLADQIESAYQRIGVTRSHYFVMGMILLGVFFDALEQNAVGITGRSCGNRGAWTPGTSAC